MTSTWSPKNYGGRIYYDPREELAARVRRAVDGNDLYVAIPISLATACAELRECRSSVISCGDEDGPLPPQRLFCSRPEDHERYGVGHSNGYMSWTRGESRD